MNTKLIINLPTNAKKAGQPDLVKRISKTTYMVTAHFRTTSHETISDRIRQMLRNEISQMQSSL